MAVARDESLGSVLAALAANTTIAAAKGTAAALTGSPALLAETLHTVADAGNEVFLWVALRRSRRALVALILHRTTGSALPDALATIVIGLMLGYVAVRLTGRNRQLLSNQAIPDRYMRQLRDRLRATPGV